jgi:hypothetical protein
MKIEEFKRELRTSLEKICAEKNWSFDNPKQRGMAFEDWCFGLFAERYPAADNAAEDCIIRGDDSGIDVFFQSNETEEIYLLQCKHPKIAASISALRDEFVSVKSIEEKYPDDVVVTLSDSHFMFPQGTLKNITFAIPGTVLQHLARDHKDSLFNWNIRRFLGKKGEVNAGLRETLDKEAEHFYYYNNGISALCESFDFDHKSKRLRVSKLQIVNGAQTLGALRHANSENLDAAFVLVKLTAVKHAARETGISSSQRGDEGLPIFAFSSFVRFTLTDVLTQCPSSHNTSLTTCSNESTSPPSIKKPQSRQVAQMARSKIRDECCHLNPTFRFALYGLQANNLLRGD